MSKMKLGRVYVRLGYTVDLNNKEMVQHAKDCVYEDIMHTVKHDEVHLLVKTIIDKQAKESDIPEFLKEEENEKD